MLKHLMRYFFCLPCLAMVAERVCGQTTKLDLQGHRGCRGLYPENTLAAIIHSIELGVTTLEMDVVITKDNKVVLSHEPFMHPEIATGPAGHVFSSPKDRSVNIYKMTYEEVTLWDVGLKPHPKFPQQKKIPATKPLLKDVIDAVEKYTKTHQLKPVQYNIETKCSPATDGFYHPAPASFVGLLMEIIQQANVSKRTIIQSFDKRTLQILHEQFPSVKTSYLIEAINKKSPEALVADLGFLPDFLSPEFHLVSKEYLDACKKAKMKVIAWTVNEEKDIIAIAALGVDGIISDYPDRFSILSKR